jgi:H+/Na+-translocating ferredoxin:NAD+ oxidoreductase subunit B
MKLAQIREEDCVGCTKCITACPVDAIIGASQFLHTVLVEECIGCGLCVEPCPMDCIELVQSTVQEGSPEKKARAQLAKKRYIARQQRLAQRAAPRLLNLRDSLQQKVEIRSELQQAFERVTQKRNSSH